MFLGACHEPTKWKCPAAGKYRMLGGIRKASRLLAGFSIRRRRLCEEVFEVKIFGCTFPVSPSYYPVSAKTPNGHWARAANKGPIRTFGNFLAIAVFAAYHRFSYV